jgi:hypothetical protein
VKLIIDFVKYGTFELSAYFVRKMSDILAVKVLDSEGHSCNRRQKKY